MRSTPPEQPAPGSSDYTMVTNSNADPSKAEGTATTQVPPHEAIDPKIVENRSYLNSADNINYKGEQTFNLESQSDEFLNGPPISAGNNKDSNEVLQKPYMHTRGFTSHIPEERTEDFNMTPEN